MMKADRRLYTNAARDAVVEEDHPDAAYLLAAAGRPLNHGDVERYELELDGSARVIYPGCPALEHDGPAASREELERELAELDAELASLKARAERILARHATVGELLEAIEDSDRNTDDDSEEEGAVDDGEEGAEGSDDELAPWPLDMGAEEYLSRYPTGPNAELAQRHVDAASAEAQASDD